jgi:hypothetical protein
MGKIRYLALSAALTIGATAQAAHATVLAPGGSVSASAADVNGFILADTGWVNFSTFDLKGSFLEIAALDNTNPYGAGDISFLYQFQVTSGDAVSLSGGDFGSFSTSVEAGCEVGDSLLACTGSKLPTNVTRTADGEVVNFEFSPAVTTGTWTASLIIATNATAFLPGSMTIQDDGAFAAAGYAPCTPGGGCVPNVPGGSLSSVPEPSTWAMMVLGFVGLGFVAFRRSHKTMVAIA